jgi:iron-sulfur cluster assembly protein
VPAALRRHDEVDRHDEGSDQRGIREHVMAISLTESAAKHIQKQVAKAGGIGLRLGVKKVGCSGLAYTFDIAKEASPEDETFVSHDTQVLIRREHLQYLDGTAVDFVRKGLNESFHFDNPNAKSECGCGESFNV